MNIQSLNYRGELSKKESYKNGDVVKASSWKHPGVYVRCGSKWKFIARLVQIICALFAFGAGAQTFTNIFIGTAPNDGTGDTLRTAFGKINTNFYTITNSIGVSSNSAVVTSNALQAQISAAATGLATNIATFGIKINPLVMATRWTNDPQRALAEVEMVLTDAVGGVPQFKVDVEHGTQTTNNWQVSPIGGGLGATLTTPITNRYSFRLSPSSVVKITDTSTGGATSALSKSVVFRE